MLSEAIASNPNLTGFADVSGDRRADAISVQPFANGAEGNFRVTMSMGNGRGGFGGQVFNDLPLNDPIAVLAGGAFGAIPPQSLILDRFTGTPQGWIMAYTSVIEQGQIMTWQSLLPNSDFFDNESASWAYGDINNDAFPDLVRLSNDGMVSTFAGGWGFNFSEPVTTFAFSGGNARQLSLGDFDHDGWTDMAAVTSSGVQVAPAVGGNPCAPATSLTLQTGNASITTLAAADVNRDGWDDLVVGLSDRSTLTLLQRKDGLSHVPFRSIGAIASSATAMHGADADGDGDIDLLITVAAQGGSSLTLALNNGTGVFSPVKSERTTNMMLLDAEFSGIDPAQVA